jgi:AcrR family transcriptional regulator
MSTETQGDANGDRPYHRGGLPADLVRTSFELLAENGLADFSVAKVARRLGISTAAPYRHYRDRAQLLAAVATAAARELADEVRTAADSAGPDPLDRFAAVAPAYVRFAATRGAGFDVIFAPELTELRDQPLAAAGRDLMDLLTTLAEATGAPSKPDALRLVEYLVTLSHGYATLHRNGFFTRGDRHDLDSLAAHAAEAVRTLCAR